MGYVIALVSSALGGNLPIYWFILGMFGVAGGLALSPLWLLVITIVAIVAAVLAINRWGYVGGFYLEVCSAAALLFPMWAAWLGALVYSMAAQ